MIRGADAPLWRYFRRPTPTSKPDIKLGERNLTTSRNLVEASASSKPHPIGRGRIAAAPRECYPRDWHALGLIFIEVELEG